MKKIIKLIIYFSMMGTVTGKLPISPIINIIGIFIFIKKKITINKYILPLFALLIYSLFHIIILTPDSLLKYEFYRYDGNLFPSYLPLFFLSFFAIKFDFNRLIKYYLIFGVVTIFISLFLFSFSPFKAHNALGGFIAELICIAIGVLYCEYKIKKRKQITKILLYLILFLISILLLFKSESRGSIIGVLFSIFFVLLLPKFRKIFFLLMLFLLIIFELLFAYPEWVNIGKSYSFFEYKEISINIEGGRWWTIVDRIFYLWPRALDDWLNSPIFGIGFSKYNDIPYQFYGIKHLVMFNLNHSVYSDFHSHNSFLHFLAETGLFGLVLLILSIFYLDKFIEKKLDNPVEKYTILLLLWYLVFSSFTEHRFTTPSQAIPFSILFGMAISNYRYKIKFSKKFIVDGGK